MATVSHVVARIIQAKPMLFDALIHDIVSYANLADYMHKQVEQELGEHVEAPAIIMAIRRYRERMKEKEDTKIPFKFHSEVLMRTGLSDLTYVRTTSLLTKLRKVYELIEYEKGETMNIIHGNYEVTIVISERRIDKLKTILSDEILINSEGDMVSLTMSFSKDFLYTPGILARVTRELFWENVNVYENISTMTELIFIVQKKDSVRAYNALVRLVEGK